MKENKQWFQHIMLYYFKKGKNTTEIKKKIFVVYGQGAVTDQTCQKFIVKFCAGDFSLDDAPWSGRPMEVDNDQIETLIENNQCYTTWDSQHTQNVQINKGIGENEICVFYFTEKTKWSFWPTQYLLNESVFPVKI